MPDTRQPLDPELVALIQRVRSRLRQLPRYELAEWIRERDPAADWGYVLGVFVQAATEADFQRERLEALRRILGRMRGPALYPKRFKANLNAVVTACEDLGATIADLAEARGWEAVSEAVGSFTPAEVRDAPDEAMTRFRAALQRLICDDLLPGHDWKQARRRSSPLSEAETHAIEDEALAAAEVAEELDALATRAGLTAYQGQVLRLYRTGFSNREIAEQLDKSEAAIRRVLSDARAKMRTVARSER